MGRNIISLFQNPLFSIKMMISITALVDTIVLSHGHYDHTGGLLTVLDEARSANLYLHPQAAKPKFACYKDKPFRNYHLQQIALAHCTGDNAVGKFRKALGQRCFSCSVGSKNNYL
jgi:metal-dependent hydrolase (beta-lactamase superfamily II)